MSVPTLTALLPVVQVTGALQAPSRWTLRGSGGQSFGCFLAGGIEVKLTGEANDYIGKGMAGGELVIVPPPGMCTVRAAQSCWSTGLSHCADVCAIASGGPVPWTCAHEICLLLCPCDLYGSKLPCVQFRLHNGSRLV